MRWRTGLRVAGAATLGGLITAAAFPPWSAWPGAVLGPALLVVALQQHDRDASAVRRARRAAGVGLLFGAAFMLPLLWWLADSISPVAWLALGLVQALWFALLGVANLAMRPTWWGAAWFALTWIVVESARSTWPFGGLPWGRLGDTAVDSPFQPALAYLGVAGLTGMATLAAGAAVAALRFGGTHSAAGVGSRMVPACTLLVVIGLALLPAAVPWQGREAGMMRIAVVQGGVPGDGRNLVDNHRQVTANHVAATIALARRIERGLVARPDLVVWPENSTAVDPFRDPEIRAGLDDAADAVGVPVLIGAMVDGPQEDTVLNQGIVWSSQGPTAQRYTKHHPVPFGEYIPFRGVLGRLSPRLDEVPRDMLAGTSKSPLNIGGTQVADAICFDVAYDDALRDQVLAGAEVAVVQTSNASFFGTTQLEQQLAITRARAAILGRSVAVASTNGVTAVIDSRGNLIDRAPIGSTQVLMEEVPLRSDLTPAVRLGPAIPFTAAVLVALGLLARLWPVRDARRPGRGSGRPTDAPGSRCTPSDLGRRHGQPSGPDDAAHAGPKRPTMR